MEHDTFDPFAWPAFELCGELAEVAAAWRGGNGVVDCSDSQTWAAVNPAGKDTFWHIAPRHAGTVMGWLLDAQLRQPGATAFTVVVALAGVRRWRRAAKHFRSKTRVRLEVPGLGKVWHMVLRYEAGDGMLGKVPHVVEEEEDRLLGADEGAWEADILHTHFTHARDRRAAGFDAEVGGRGAATTGAGADSGLAGSGATV